MHSCLATVPEPPGGSVVSQEQHQHEQDQSCHIQRVDYHQGQHPAAHELCLCTVPLTCVMITIYNYSKTGCDLCV